MNGVYVSGEWPTTEPSTIRRISTILRNLTSNSTRRKREKLWFHELPPAARRNIFYCPPALVEKATEAQQKTASTSQILSVSFKTQNILEETNEALLTFDKSRGNDFAAVMVTLRFVSGT